MIHWLRFAAAARLAALLCLLGSPAWAAGVHHEITARLDPSSGRLAVSDAITVEGRDRVALRVAPWQRITEIALDGRTLPGAATEIALPDRARHVIAVTLKGAAPKLGAGGGIRTAGISAIAGPEGAYLPGFGGWLPDTGDALVTHHLTVSVPAAFRVLSTGEPVAETVANGTRRAEYRARHPAELPSVFAGPYVVAERKAGGTVLRTYLHRDIADLADSYLSAAARYIGRYAKAIGPYPYERFSVVSAPVPVGLGFPSLTYVGRRVLALPFMQGRSLAHEVLHNWWGNGVSIDYATGNWAEGLTTYMADYALAADRGAGVARDMRIGWLRDYAALPAARDLPVRTFRGKRHDASQVIGYNKTAFVFHMLEDEIGRAAFRDGLRRFWQAHRYTVAGWADLQAAFEAAAGRRLGWFFSQWIDRPGAPVLTLADAHATRRNGKPALSLTIRQAAPPYRLTLPVRIETARGAVMRKVTIKGLAVTATLALDAPAHAVHVDPDFDVFRRLARMETPPILRDVTLASDAVAVIADDDPETAKAARALAARLADDGIGRADAARPLPAKPALVIGTEKAVAAVLERAGLHRPDGIAGGTARAWTARRANGLPVLVVEAQDAASLRALIRPLRHYGRRSFVVFDGARAVRRGVWPLAASPLRRVLRDAP